MNRQTQSLLVLVVATFVLGAWGCPPPPIPPDAGPPGGEGGVLDSTPGTGGQAGGEGSPGLLDAQPQTPCFRAYVTLNAHGCEEAVKPEEFLKTCLHLSSEPIVVWSPACVAGAQNLQTLRACPLITCTAGR